MAVGAIITMTSTSLVDASEKQHLTLIITVGTVAIASLGERDGNNRNNDHYGVGFVGFHEGNGTITFTRVAIIIMGHLIDSCGHRDNSDHHSD